MRSRPETQHCEVKLWHLIAVTLLTLLACTLCARWLARPVRITADAACGAGYGSGLCWGKDGGGYEHIGAREHLRKTARDAVLHLSGPPAAKQPPANHDQLAAHRERDRGAARRPGQADAVARGVGKATQRTCGAPSQRKRTRGRNRWQRDSPQEVAHEVAQVGQEKNT